MSASIFIHTVVSLILYPGKASSACSVFIATINANAYIVDAYGIFCCVKSYSHLLHIQFHSSVLGKITFIKNYINQMFTHFKSALCWHFVYKVWLATPSCRSISYFKMVQVPSIGKRCINFQCCPTIQTQTSSETSRNCVLRARSVLYLYFSYHNQRELDPKIV